MGAKPVWSMVSIGIPVSFAGAIMLMPWLGVSINMISLFAFILAIPCWDPAFEGLGFIEAIALPFSPAAAPHAWPEGTCWSGFFVVEIGRSARLLGGDAPQAHTFIGEENGRSSQQKLAELQDRIQPPTLEKQNASTEQADGGEEAAGLHPRESDAAGCALALALFGRGF